MTRHMSQTTKLRLILTSNVHFEIGKWLDDASEVSNYKTTPDFSTNILKFNEALDAS